MQPRKCYLHPGVVLRTSDDLDAHDALHYREERRYEQENLDRLEAIFVSHGMVQTAPGVWLPKDAVA